MGKKLIIENIGALSYETFGNDYLMHLINIGDDNYNFQFKRTTDTTIVDVTLSRNGRWDSEYQKWMYQFGPGEHWVTADWFGIKENAIKTFQDYLK